MPRKKAKSITPASPAPNTIADESATIHSERPKTGVWATAKFNFTPDPKVMQQYLDLLNQGKTHEEAIAIIESKSLPE